MPNRETKQQYSGKTKRICLGTLIQNNTTTRIFQCKVKLAYSISTIFCQRQAYHLLNILHTYYIYRTMNFDLTIVMYGDANFKHTLIRKHITVFVPNHYMFDPQYSMFEVHVNCCLETACSFLYVVLRYMYCYECTEQVATPEAVKEQCFLGITFYYGNN